MIRLDSYIYKFAERSPDKTALILGENKLSYSELCRQSEKTALFLLKNGIKKGDSVAYALAPGFHFFELLIASSMIGATATGLPLKANAATIAPLLYVAKSKLIICENGLKESFASAGNIGVAAVSEIDCISLDENREYMQTLEEYKSQVTPDTPLLHIFTSGTTGRPKCAVLTHKNIIASALAQDELLLPGGVTQNDVFLHCFPLNHVSGAIESGLAPLFVGTTAILCPAFKPDIVLEAMEKYKATVLCGVPAMWVMLFSAMSGRKYDLSSVRMGVSGAAALTSDMAKKIISLCGSLINPMGMTETSGFCSYYPDDATDDERIFTCGKIYPQLEYCISDENEAPVAKGTIGELYLKGDAVISGYLTDKMSISKDGYYKTGDLAFEDERGYIHLEGRKDDMFTVGGFNVYPQEIEEKILKCQGIASACVLPEPHHSMGNVPRAYIQCSAGSSFDAEKLKEYLESELIYYKVPRRIIIVDKMPINTLGKISRQTFAEEIKKEYSEKED